MNHTSPSGKLALATVLLAALPGVCVCGAALGTTEATLLTQSHVAQYRRWTRVNPRPVIFHAADARQCAVFTNQMPSIHRDKYITVYVNEVGKHAMLTQEKPAFPVGTVIVKEKRATPGAAPELLTVMVKHEKGFNAGNGDWEYAVFNGNAARVQAQGKLARCQSCHQAQKDLDYTFRNAYFTCHKLDLTGGPRRNPRRRNAPERGVASSAARAMAK